MTAKIVSMRHVRLSRMSPAEKAARREAQRRYREAVNNNEYQKREWDHRTRAAVMDKMVEMIQADVLASFADPGDATLREITDRVTAAVSSLNHNVEQAQALFDRAWKILMREKPQIFVLHQARVPPKPL